MVHEKVNFDDGNFEGQATESWFSFDRCGCFILGLPRSLSHAHLDAAGDGWPTRSAGTAREGCLEIAIAAPGLGPVKEWGRPINLLDDCISQMVPLECGLFRNAISSDFEPFPVRNSSKFASFADLSTANACQCRKWRMPVKTIAIPRRSAAAMTS
jgi:hypothetical protein